MDCSGQDLGCGVVVLLLMNSSSRGVVFVPVYAPLVIISPILMLFVLATTKMIFLTRLMTASKFHQTNNHARSFKDFSFHCHPTMSQGVKVSESKHDEKAKGFNLNKQYQQTVHPLGE